MLSAIPVKTHYKWLQWEESNTSLILVHACHSLTCFPNTHVICSTSVSADRFSSPPDHPYFDLQCVLPLLVMGKIHRVMTDVLSVEATYFTCACIIVKVVFHFFICPLWKKVCKLCKYLESVCQSSHGKVMLWPVRCNDKAHVATVF